MTTMDFNQYRKIIEDDIDWLRKQPQTCERRHIEEILLKEQQQQVKVEPEVKVQIAEIVERHIIAHEQMKQNYLGKNLEMYSKAGGAMLALEKLLKDLRKSNLSA